MGDGRSLTEFASNHRVKTGPVAWVTTIPEYEECAAGYRAGTGLHVIRKWLIDERGYSTVEATINRLQHLARTIERDKK